MTKNNKNKDSPTLNELVTQKMFYGFDHQEDVTVEGMFVDEMLVNCSDEPYKLGCGGCVPDSQYKYNSTSKELDDYLNYGLSSIDI